MRTENQASGAGTVSPRLLSARDAARRLGISRRALDHLVDDGKLLSLRLLSPRGKRWFEAVEVDALVDQLKAQVRHEMDPNETKLRVRQFVDRVHGRA